MIPHLRRLDPWPTAWTPKPAVPKPQTTPLRPYQTPTTAITPRCRSPTTRRAHRL